MALDVIVKIDLAQPIGSIGLGTPLLLATGATKDMEYTECKSLTAVKDAGFADTTDLYKAARILFKQDDAPAVIAVCATTGTAKEWLDVTDNIVKGWRQLLVFGENINVQEIITVIDTTRDKMYFADIDIDSKETYSTQDVERTVLVYAKATEDVPSYAAAVVGATAGKPAGGINYKNMIIKGVKAHDLKDSELGAIHAKGGLTIVKKSGDIVTSMGKVAGGQYIDLRDAIDYVISNIEYRTQKVLNLNDKIKFDNTGIAILENACVDVMRDAYSKGIIATDENGEPMYAVNYVRREDTEASDRAARNYKGGQFTFTCAGAVDTVNVLGELSI